MVAIYLSLSQWKLSNFNNVRRLYKQKNFSEHASKP